MMGTATILTKIENMKKMWRLSFVFLVLALGASTAVALDPMGPPAAGLAEGQLKIGIDYSHSTMDLELDNGTWTEFLDGAFYDAGEAVPFTLKNFKAHRTYTNIGFGASDRIEAFLRVGGTEGRFDDSIWEDQERFEGSDDLAVGGGIKATFYDDGALQIGGLFQGSWAEYNGTLSAPHWSSADRVEVDLTQFQIALGATYTWSERFSVYGGPFLHFVSGDLDDTLNQLSETEPVGLLTSEYSWDINEDSVFGAYAGVQLEFTENCSFNLEYQRTASADAVGMSLSWRR